MHALRRITSGNTAPRVRYAPFQGPRSATSPGTGAPSKKTSLSQQDQDKADDEQRREAMRDLVESWMDRLQLISVITTFFASTEASLLSITSPNGNGNSPSGPMSIAAQLANVGIVGALVVHSNAAIISFLAAFVLIRYKLKVAKTEEKQAEQKAPTPGEKNQKNGGASHQHHEFVESPRTSTVPTDIERAHSPAERTDTGGWRPPESEHETDPIPGRVRVSIPLFGSSTLEPIWSTNPHLVQVGPFQSLPPTHLLSRCHSLCIILSALGFFLALMGILCFAWDSMPLSVSVSASFFMGLCIVAGAVIVFWPDPAEGEMSSRIYVLNDD